MTDYAYVYNVGAGTVAVDALVPFDTNGPLTAGFTHTPPFGQVILVNAGTYELHWFVSGVEPNQFHPYLNGSPIQNAYGSGAGTQQNNGQTIFVAAAGDTLTLHNHTSSAAVTLQTLAGGTQINVNASMLIKRLA